MRAIVYDRYGSPDRLALQDVERPIATGEEVLVRVQAASVNPLDWHFMRGKPYFMRVAISGLLKPKNRILGYDVAGTVAAVGEAVTQFAPGDEVYGATGFSLGAFAEYVCVPESSLYPRPAGMSAEEAAAVPVAAVTAVQGLRDKRTIQAGDRV